MDRLLRWKEVRGCTLTPLYPGSWVSIAEDKEQGLVHAGLQNQSRAGRWEAPEATLQVFLHVS